MTRRAFWNMHGPGCNEHFLVHMLRESEDYLPEFSRVAELDGEIVGVIMYSCATVVDGEKVHEVVTFGPLCTEPTLQNSGVGALLLAETLPLLKEAGYPGVVIFGEPDYYPKRGFVTCDHFGITDPEGKNYTSLLAYKLNDAFDQIHGKYDKQQQTGQGRQFTADAENRQQYRARHHQNCLALKLNFIDH